MWNGGCLDYIVLPNILPRELQGEYHAKRTEKCKIIGQFLDKEVENLVDHGCSKTRVIVAPEADEEIWIRSSYPIRHKTALHCAECKAKLLVN